MNFSGTNKMGDTRAEIVGKNKQRRSKSTIYLQKTSNGGFTIMCKVL